MVAVDDRRSRKLAVVAHCLLNQNAKAAGLALYAGVCGPVLSLLSRHGIGIVQMPCPEVSHLGPSRPLGTDTREQYDSPAYRGVCRAIAKHVVAEVSAYVESGYSVLFVLGVEGSPSCSVSRVPVLVGASGRVLKPGKGLYMELLGCELQNAGLHVPMVGIPESDLAGNLDDVLEALAHIVSESMQQPRAQRG
jgi:predicted secreted protein